MHDEALSLEPVRTHLARILFFVPGLPACSDGILHAQVLAPAAFLEQNGFKSFFVGAETDPDRARQAEDLIQRQYGLDSAIYVDNRFQIPYFGLARQASKVANQARGLVYQWKPDFIYTRAFYNVSTINRLAKPIGAVSVLDVRGVAAEETAMKRGRGLRYQFLLQRERRAINDAGRVSCVSENLKTWIHEYTCRKEIEVIPSCVDTTSFAFRSEERLSLRRAWGIVDDELLFCYSGGLTHWQRIRDVIGFFAQIGLRIPMSRFLFVTRQMERLKAILADSGLAAEKCIVTGCDHDKVDAHLSAADFGVIMRHDVVVNNVASPVKVGEYLACGLPVLLTCGIGDYSRIVPQEGLGMLLEEDGRDIERIQALLAKNDLEELRKKASGYAIKNLSWSSNLKTFQRLYSRPDHTVSRC